MLFLGAGAANPIISADKAECTAEQAYTWPIGLLPGALVHGSRVSATRDDPGGRNRCPRDRQAATDARRPSRQRTASPS
jgi:hypothetical protein